MVVDLATSIAQIASPILYAAFIVVTYFQLRSARDSVQEVRQEFLAGGRPVVAGHDEYDTTTAALNLVVRTSGRARPRTSTSSSPGRSRAPTVSCCRGCRCSRWV